MRIKIILFLAFCLLIVFFPAYSAEDSICLECHEDRELKSEEGLSLFADNNEYLISIHGQVGISCVDCHSDLAGFDDFPHPEKLRSVSCGDCHERALDEFQQSVHSQASGEAETPAVSCKDCHGKHDKKPKEN